MQEDISVSTAERPFMKIILLPLEEGSLLLLYPMFSKILSLQMQPLPMLPKDMIFPLQLPPIFLTGMYIFQEDSYLNVWPWMKFMHSSPMTVTMSV